MTDESSRFASTACFGRTRSGDVGRRDPAGDVTGGARPSRGVLMWLSSPTPAPVSGGGGSSDAPSPRNFDIGPGGGTTATGVIDRTTAREGESADADDDVGDAHNTSMSATEDEGVVGWATCGFAGTLGGDGDRRGLDTKSSKSSKLNDV
jgi:hypothetical protein